MKLTIEIDPDVPADVDAAERTLARLRGAGAAVPRPARRQKRHTMPTEPPPNELPADNVRPLVEAKVTADARRKRMIDR
jgi:hypothetical protein